MPKWLLYGLAAGGNFVVAVMTYRSGRIVVPIVLVAAGVCFVMATIGAARETSRVRG
jgi:hypothetical protein